MLPVMPEPHVDAPALAAEMIEYLRVQPQGEGWTAEVPPWFGDYAFGGWVVAQAVAAAYAAAPEGRRMHSLHAYFLRPVAVGRPVSYRSIALREGRTVVTRRLDATQDGKPVLAMSYSFTTDTTGYEYDLPIAREVPDPNGLPFETGPGPWIAAYLGPTPAGADGTRSSTHRAWVRVAARLPDDPWIHAAFVAFATDWTGTGGRPLHLAGDTRGMISLDHAAWFHRPLRADEWTFIDVHSLVNAGGRGLLRGSVHGPDRRVAASMTQEMLLQSVE